MIKESIYHEDRGTINVYISNNRAAKYVTQKPTELEGLIDKSDIIFGDFPILLSAVDRKTRQKIINDTEELHTTKNWRDLTNIYRTLHQRTAGYVLLPSIYEQRHEYIISCIIKQISTHF